MLAEYQHEKREQEERRKSPKDYLTSVEREALRRPKSKRAMSSKGIEFVRDDDGIYTVGWMHEDGKLTKTISWNRKGTTSIEDISNIVISREDGSTDLRQLGFSKNGVSSRIEYNGRGDKQYVVQYQPLGKAKEEFYDNDGRWHKCVVYHKNGERASEYYGYHECEDDSRNVYWDAAGNTQTQDEYFTAKRGPTWRQDYYRESERAKQQNIKGLQEAFRRNGVGN